MDEALDEIAEILAFTHPTAVLDRQLAFGELTLTIARDKIAPVARTLRDDPKLAFVSLIDICGVDYPARAERFDVVYHFLSPTQNLRLRLKVTTDADTPVPSLVPVFAGADWFEREAYDLYGILFDGHPDLRRILTDYGFEGYPLRKDFPLTGYVEVHYDDAQRRVVYDTVHLPQEYRDFDFLSPWEGAEYTLPGDEKKSQ
ncbi:MAG: NADH-quinone oxidoreductase subunit C [Bauldia sp.]|nr:NADH-quinone oxidoreductase subunit C [Bauldia sp.]